MLSKLSELGVELIRADNTRSQPEINLDLKRFNRSNLPVNIIVPADPSQPYIVMPELISPQDALKALAKAAGTPSTAVTQN